MLVKTVCMFPMLIGIMIIVVLSYIKVARGIWMNESGIWSILLFVAIYIGPNDEGLVDLDGNNTMFLNEMCVILECI